MHPWVARIDVGPSRGTGFVVAEGLALTALHVLGERSRTPFTLYGDILLTFQNGTASATLHEDFWDLNADWALLKFQMTSAAAAPPVLPLADVPAKDTNWWTFGFPDANPGGMVFVGQVSDPQADLQGAASLQLFSREAASGKGPPVKGLSGAPVLVGDGQNKVAVVGLLRYALSRDNEAVAGTLYACPIASVLKKADTLLAVPDPCHGLPGLPNQKLPLEPFKHLAWFTEQDAEIFFGRNRQIGDTYRLLTRDDALPILLLYGQAGVGKSSFLDAGLLPRLKWHHRVSYVRRDPRRTLLQTLRDELKAGPNDSLAAAWRAVEEAHGKPLLVFLDQIEEIYTHPNLDVPGELEEFSRELPGLFDPAEPVKGRLVLSFRKEWFPEIQKQLEEEIGIKCSKLFLEVLDRDSVKEAIVGVTGTERLRAAYGLAIDPGLADVMASKLLEDRDSPVAPTLQILLTKMWAKATARSRSTPRMTLDDFLALKAEGLGLGDFLDQQLEALKAEHAEWVDSGFALDVLSYHVTPSLTTRE
jgi:hypothetical protein